MERLEAKQVKGHTYYYYSKWARVDGRCRRVWQRYLGKLTDIVEAVEGGPQPISAEVFQWGLPEALWKECRGTQLVSIVDRHCRKRKQGLTTGEYLAIAAVNRAIRPQSKRSMWEWFSQTVLPRHVSAASADALSSQRFWDHMDRIDSDALAAVWKELLQSVIHRETIDLSSVSYDGANFYTFIDTFNVHCEIAKRGKNKQGRNNLRQVSYGLFCCADGHLPLFYDVYDGNRNDAKQFPQMLRRFHAFFREIAGEQFPMPETTVVFDKGNNSEDNFRLLDELELKFVGSVKLDQHRDLAEIPNNDPRFIHCTSADLEGTKAFRVTRKVAGRDRVLVVTYNQSLFDSQWQTLQQDIARALEKLAALRARLEDRATGLIKGGRAPSIASVEKQCQAILGRQYMKRVIRTHVRDGNDKLPRLEYSVDALALDTLSKTYLGKNLVITNRSEWENERVISAYRSQFIIESVFKETKDRSVGTWWPLHHWTDSKIRVHAFYCTIALLLRALMLRRVQAADLGISMARLLRELDGIREVLTIYPSKGRRKRESTRTVLTKTSDLQRELLSALRIESQTAPLG
ncbi:MAG: IS1634 family transposase [Planctomycetota bacterium]